MKIILKNNSLIKEIGLQDFDEVAKSEKPYIIKFTNSTCHLCKELKPIFEEIAEEFKQNFKFGNVNSKKERQLFNMFKIDGVPEIFIIYNDNIINMSYPDKPDPKSGYSKQYIIDHLNEFLQSEYMGGC